MSIFNKRQEEEIEEEKFEEEKLSRKKIRDLKPENRKKRKEPPRPWGKKERYLILTFFLGTVAFSAILAASSRSWKLPGLPNISLPSFGEETIIIPSTKNSKVKFEKITASFREKTNQLSGIYALEVVDLESDTSFGTSDTKQLQAASLIKLPALAALYMEAEKGTIGLDETYTLLNSDKRTGAGSLYSKAEGTSLTYRELARLMGKESDNTAFAIVRKKLGDSRINQAIDEIGMKSTSLKENKTSAYDIALFFKKLWKGDLVSEAFRDEILEYLTDTAYEDWIVKGIPEEVRVAHKYGRELHVVNDAGIVFAEKPFVLVIITQGIIEKEADTIIPELARNVYEELAN
jgi:beta-lactamase class A